MRRRRLLATGTLTALAGCLTPAEPNEDRTGSELVEAAIETRLELTDLQARRHLTAETPAETTTQTESISRRPPAEKRRTVLRSDDGDPPAGTVSVTNREISWDYYPEENFVWKRYHPNKVVADGPRLVLKDLLEDYELTYDGTDTVDGRETHRIDAVPTGTGLSDDADGRAIELLVGETVYRIPLGGSSDTDAPAESKNGSENGSENETEATDDELDGEELAVSRTVWIDDEFSYPIKERDVVRDGDGTLLHRLTVTYEDLAINDGLDPDTFVYEPPEDAEVGTLGDEPEGIYESREAAATTVPYEIPDPDVPDAYELDRVTVVDNVRQSGPVTTLWYVDSDRPDQEISVAVRTDQQFKPNLLEETEIDGHTAYRRRGRIDSYFWTCSDLSYEVSSVTVEEPLVDVAASIGCS
ncbi:LolA family protein [Natrialba asiatica]|uniref:DUF2092 domain-containing protein n=1 Tax=Natrialba asiatica (strain ATCC 700177 / DSM 12278 / JCM 9576 / FERM P-10747 / NBRC 102637 / 172P1) TaxID=29540 RepID=M0AQ82_NATA1|nr:hypothetical protein [Natrialba asiatica]ELZ00088.1 hypothetical protein C481_13869 [Natrialba asiatica DSM 12278]